MSVESEFFSDPNTGHKTGDRPVLKCGQCGQSWRQENISRRPVKCPMCSSRFWDCAKGFEVTQKQREEILKRAAFDVLKGHDVVTFGRQRKSGNIVALSPFMVRQWRIDPDTWGVLLGEYTRKDYETAVHNLLRRPFEQNNQAAGG